MGFNYSLHNNLINLISQSKGLINKKNSARMGALRAFELGLRPNKEEWKYTTLSWDQRSICLPGAAATPDTKWIPVPSSGYYLIVYNGVLLVEQSRVWDGAQINQIKRSDKSGPNLVNRSICPETYFSSLNTALSEGVQIEISKNINAPVEIIYAYDSERPALCQTRIAIQLNENVDIQTVERTFFKQEKSFHVSNDIVEVIMKKNSSWKNFLFEDRGEQNQNIRSYYITQHKSSQSAFYDFSFGEGLYRKNLNILLLEEFSTTSLYSISLLYSGHVDHKISLKHAAPNCSSYQIYKGVYGGTSTGVFNGGVIVDRIAQKTDAFQQNNNIIISDGATVHAKPQLEIFADDVSCSHGCTVGQIDEQTLFYVQSRGIGKKEAQKMLLVAFFNDVISKINSTSISEEVLKGLYKILKK